MYLNIVILIKGPQMATAIYHFFPGLKLLTIGTNGWYSTVRYNSLHLHPIMDK